MSARSSLSRNAGRIGRIARIARALLPLGAASGCELTGTTAPEVEPRVVVHAVLNPTTTTQSVIVEQTLRSIGHDPGQVAYEPITNARVVIYGVANDSIVVRESIPGSPGVYRIPTSPTTSAPNVLRLVPGGRYRLRVETAIGVVSGQTVVPLVTGVDGSRRTFNVDRDTLRVDATRVRQAAGFLLRHESRSATLERFVTRLEETLMRPLTSIADDDGWSFEFAHQIIQPGRPQNFIVVAVDSNYFRYHEGGFDPFGDETRGNTLTGGVGLFGSVAPVMAKTLDLTADIDTPIEGGWIADRASLTLPFTMTLYASPTYPGDRPFDPRVNLSGTARLAGGLRLEVAATGDGTVRSFTFVEPNDQFTVFAQGELNGSTLVLMDRQTGERVTYRKP